jgi:hypothetical protein
VSPLESIDLPASLHIAGAPRQQLAKYLHRLPMSLCSSSFGELNAPDEDFSGKLNISREFGSFEDLDAQAPVVPGRGTPEIDISAQEAIEQEPELDKLYGTIESQSPFSYDGTFSPEVRLLVLSPRTSLQGELNGRLETIRLSDAPSYIAVSYEWEGPQNRDGCVLNLHIQDHTIPLKPNLAHALIFFQKNLTEVTYLWIDAICINQANVEERGQQVQIMNEIYQQAHAVWVWLGPASHDSDLAMNVMDKVSMFPEDMKGEHSRPIKWVNRLLYDSSYAAHRLALCHLFRRSYWKRLWVVQELVLGACTDSPMLCCGDRKSNLGHIIKLAKGIRTVIQSGQISGKKKGTMLQKLERAVKVIIDLADHIDEYSDKAQDAGEVDLLSLLTRYTGNQCSDPRDKVYALLGIAFSQDDSLPVDYSVDLREVCKRTALYIIDTSQRLDLLSLCSLQEGEVEKDISEHIESPTTPEEPGAAVGIHVSPSEYERRKQKRRDRRSRRRRCFPLNLVVYFLTLCRANTIRRILPAS